MTWERFKFSTRDVRDVVGGVFFANLNKYVIGTSFTV